MHSLNLERRNVFNNISFSPNTLRTAAACSVLKGGLLSVTCNINIVLYSVHLYCTVYTCTVHFFYRILNQFILQCMLPLTCNVADVFATPDRCICHLTDVIASPGRFICHLADVFATPDRCNCLTWQIYLSPDRCNCLT